MAKILGNDLVSRSICNTQARFSVWDVCFNHNCVTGSKMRSGKYSAAGDKLRAAITPGAHIDFYIVNGLFRVQKHFFCVTLDHDLGKLGIILQICSGEQFGRKLTLYNVFFRREVGVLNNTCQLAVRDLRNYKSGGTGSDFIGGEAEA